MGIDAYGTKYWQSFTSVGDNGWRWFEPADPHWFRGRDQVTPPPEWYKSLVGHTAHTPQQMKARGEWGMHG